MATIVRSWDTPGPTWSPQTGWTDTVLWQVVGATSDKAAMDLIKNSSAGLDGQLYHPDSVDYPSLRCASLAFAQRPGPDTRIIQGNFVEARFVWDPTKTLLNFEYAWREEPVSSDAEGNSIQNSAGDPFDPPLMRQYLSLIVNLKLRVWSFDIIGLMAYANALNSDSFTFPPTGTTIAPRHMKCCIALPEGWYEFPMVEGSYIDAVFKFEYRPEGFKFKVPDVGFRAWGKSQASATSKKHNIAEKSGNPISTPARLNHGKAKDTDFRFVKDSFYQWSDPVNKAGTAGPNVFLPQKPTGDAPPYDETTGGDDGVNYLEFRLLVSKVFATLPCFQTI